MVASGNYAAAAALCGDAHDVGTFCHYSLPPPANTTGVVVSCLLHSTEIQRATRSGPSCGTHIATTCFILLMFTRYLLLNQVLSVVVTCLMSSFPEPDLCIQAPSQWTCKAAARSGAS